MAAAYARVAFRQRHRFFRLTIAFGAGMIAIGAFFSLPPSAGEQATAVFVFMGLLVLIVGVWAVLTMAKACNFVEIGDSGVTVERVDGQRFSHRWSDLTVQFSVKCVPPNNWFRRTPGLEHLDFVLQFTDRLEAPVSREAVDLLQSQALAHHWPIDDWHSGPMQDRQEIFFGPVRRTIW
jgi:hypothetical protein